MKNGFYLLDIRRGQNLVSENIDDYVIVIRHRLCLMETYNWSSYVNLKRDKNFVIPGTYLWIGNGRESMLTNSVVTNVS
jgi:hypothetical protein